MLSNCDALETPLEARRSHLSILKEINPDYSLQGGLLLKLKLQYFGHPMQYFGHLMQRADTLEKTLMLGKMESKRIRGWQKMRWLDSITLNGHEFEQIAGDSGGQRRLVCCSPWGRKDLATEHQQQGKGKKRELITPNISPAISEHFHFILANTDSLTR